MSRNITTSLSEKLNQSGSDIVLLAFLTITHPEVETPIYLVNDGVNYVRNGITWLAIPFDVNLLTDTDAQPECQLMVPNIDRSIGHSIKNVTGPCRLKIELIEGGAFDQTTDPRTEIGTAPVEYMANHLYLVNVSVDAQSVSGTVKSFYYRDEPYPYIRATENIAPAVYR